MMLTCSAAAAVVITRLAFERTVSHHWSAISSLGLTSIVKALKEKTAALVRIHHVHSSAG